MTCIPAADHQATLSVGSPISADAILLVAELGQLNNTPSWPATADVQSSLCMVCLPTVWMRTPHRGLHPILCLLHIHIRPHVTHPHTPTVVSSCRVNEPPPSKLSANRKTNIPGLCSLDPQSAGLLGSAVLTFAGSYQHCNLNAAGESNTIFSSCP